MKEFFKSLFKIAVSDTSKIRHEQLLELLKSQELTFKEMNTRMNYGLIGHLLSTRDSKMSVLIYPEAFYVRDGDLSMNKDTLEIIKLVREFYRELRRANGRVIPPVTLN